LAASLVWVDDFTTETTEVIAAELSARAAEPDPPDGLPRNDPAPARVEQRWCTDSWDVRCLEPAVVAAGIAFPAASNAAHWDPPGGPVHVFVFGLVRLCGWTLTAILLAGVTGLLRQ